MTIDGTLDPLQRLAARLGIVPTYRDVWLQDRPTDPATLNALLSVMGFPAGNDEEIAASLQKSEELDWSGLLRPVSVLDAHVPNAVPIVLSGDASGTLTWRITPEGAEPIEGRARIEDLAVDTRHGDRVRRLLPISEDLPIGYHRLQVFSSGESDEATLILAPPHCYMPDDFAGDDFGIDSRGEGRVWGLAAQLYSLRSSRNWGIGDLSDLKELALGSAPRGARAIGLNPLHALFPGEPRHVSPYSPSSRRFLNPIYLDVEAVPDFEECLAAQELRKSPQFEAKLRASRESELVDHATVARAKTEILELLWDSFRQKHLGAEADGSLSERGRNFRAFQAEFGGALYTFAVFEALHSRFGGEEFCWTKWPEEFQHADSAEVTAFARGNGERIEYFMYLQWEMDRQLADVAYFANAAGLAVGLYRDIAVGVDPNGADRWIDRGLLFHGATIGAPPDFLNRKGQNWGLSAMDPVALKARAYQPFIEAVRANMRHAGAIRLDHVMVLRQLYVVPQGFDATKGAYVRYPFEDLLRIVALESQRARCAVVGEDLGTVPDGFRETLAEFRILSYRLLVFERKADGTFEPPSAYPPLSTASVGTHDLATLKGFWLGKDIDWRERLDLYPDPAMGPAERVQRADERRRLVDALIGQGVLPEDLANDMMEDNEAPHFRLELVEAVHRYLGQSPARLMLIQMEDAIGSDEMINLPGTTDQHPNWRRKLSLSVSEILGDEFFRRLTAAVDEARAARMHP